MRQTGIETESHETGWHSNRKTVRQTGSGTETERQKQTGTGTETDWHRDIKTVRQRDRPAQRQKDS